MNFNCIRRQHSAQNINRNLCTLNAKVNMYCLLNGNIFIIFILLSFTNLNILKHANMINKMLSHGQIMW